MTNATTFIFYSIKYIGNKSMLYSYLILLYLHISIRLVIHQYNFILIGYLLKLFN